MEVLRIGDYAMRKINEQDLPSLLEWRNSDRIHSMMLTDHRISWDEHVAWFDRIKSAERPVNFIFTYKGEDIGYIGYSGINWQSMFCYPGTYLGKFDKKNIMAGIILHEITIKYAFEYLHMHKLCSYVFAKNKRVRKINELLGYRQEGYFRKHFFKDNEYQDVVFLSVLQEEWLEISDSYLINVF